MHPVAKLREGATVRIDDVRTVVDFPNPEFKVVGAARTFDLDGETQTVFKVKNVDNDVELLLLVKEVPSDHPKQTYVDFKVFELQEWFKEGSRLDQIVQNENGWLYDIPELETEPDEDWYAGLDYASTIVVEGGEGNDVTFTRKQRTEMGRVDGDPASLLEYETDADIDNFEIMVFETGGIGSDRGGWVEYYQGRRVTEDDVHIDQAGLQFLND